MPPRPATLDDYRWLYANGYMTDGLKCARDIMPDIEARCPATFLDFGCGRGHLVHWINTQTAGRCAGWDPADHPGEALCPRAHAEWVIACDVLEHVAWAHIDQTILMLGKMAGRGLLLTIANMSDVHLVNGEEVELHLIRRPADWWINTFQCAFPGSRFTHRVINSDRFTLIVEFPS